MKASDSFKIQVIIDKVPEDASKWVYPNSPRGHIFQESTLCRQILDEKIHISLLQHLKTWPQPACNSLSL